MQTTRTYPYKKILVIGSPGGGKSTFSKALHAITGIPLYHLDLLYWNPDRTTVSREVFRTRLWEVLERDAWIIDGNYGSTLAMRIEVCDAVVFLDFPAEVCLAGIRARQGKARSDMPWIETEDDPEFLEFVKRFPTEGREQILRLLKEHPEKAVLRFRTREEAEAYLDSLRI